ncbi:MAG: phosphoribosylformylglycinamidine cyclo-ligase [Bacteroidia bacterium]|nr:phosphoribosylformylglycinamidine cyclo-ligase [Bacteroidia bacterium]
MDYYALRGVSSGKEDIHKAIAHLDKGLFPNAFCKILPDYLGSDENYCSLMHADGAGTKSSLAYLYWRETGDLSVWRGIAQDAVVMNTDDLLCAGVTHEGLILSSTIGRNRRYIPGEVIAEIISGFEEIGDFFSQLGMPIYRAGGETADVGDLVRTIIVDATVTTRILRKNVISNAKISPESVIVGIASDGQASYETSYNSGIGSNGLTSARHDLFCHEYTTTYPESFDHLLDPKAAYVGKYRVTDIHPELSITIGKLALSPTRTYAPFLLLIINELRDKIHGLIHCTGGGQTKCLHFIDKLHIVKNNLFPVPPIFQLIQQTMPTPWSAMYKTFNMGHRLEIYTDIQTANQIIQAAHSFNLKAQVIGFCEPSAHKKLTIQVGDSCYEY